MENAGKPRLGRWPIHVVLFGPFFVLSFYASNIEQFPIKVTFVTIAVRQHCAGATGKNRILVLVVFPDRRAQIFWIDLTHSLGADAVLVLTIGV